MEILYMFNSTNLICIYHFSYTMDILLREIICQAFMCSVSEFYAEWRQSTTNITHYCNYPYVIIDKFR